MDVTYQSCDSKIFRFEANIACAENWKSSRSLVRSRVFPITVVMMRNHCYPCPIRRVRFNADLAYGENQCTFVSEQQSF